VRDARRLRRGLRWSTCCRGLGKPAACRHPGGRVRRLVRIGEQQRSRGNGSCGGRLTGNFCTDFTKLSSHVPTIPPRDKGNLAALQQDSTRLLTSAAAFFSALAGESPPQVAGALRTLASAYQHDVSVAQSQTSAASLEHLIQTTQYTGSALGAFRVVTRYFYWVQLVWSDVVGQAPSVHWSCAVPVVWQTPGQRSC
jgi:hypothetical protein